MDGSLEPAVGRGRLSAELRRARGVANRTQREVAEELGWSVSKLIRIETGQVGVSKSDARALLAAYGVTDGPRMSHVAQLAAASRKQIMGEFRDVLNPEFLVYLGYEAYAARLWQFELLVVPGLLQTERYAETLIRAVARPGTPEDVLGKQIRARLARQAILERDNFAMHFLLDEAALMRRYGSKPEQNDILFEQIEHLKQSARHPGITIQVVPFSRGPHIGMTGSFAVLEFDTGDDPNVLYLETGRPNMLIRNKPEQVDTYRMAFDDLRRSASEPDALDQTLDSIIRNIPD